MRLLFVTSTLSSGGSERVMSLLANAFSARGHDVSVVCLNRHIVFYPIVDGVDVLFAEDEVGSPSILMKMLWLRRHVRRERPDVVLPFMTDVYSVTLLSLLGMKTPVVASERVDPRYSGSLYKTLRFLFVPLATRLVVQTERIKAYFPWFVRRKTSVIYNPVSCDALSDSPAERHDVVISLGRLARQKNFPMMIRAFSRIAPDFPGFELHIYGEGPCRDALQADIDRQGMTGRILLKGRTTDAVGMLRQSRLFCMSSDGEGMSNALIEAICVGLPVVTTQVSGAAELLSGGEGGVITPIGDEDAFAGALRRVLSDAALMRSMGMRNKSQAPRFHLDTIVRQWEDVIASCVETPA